MSQVAKKADPPTMIAMIAINTILEKLFMLFFTANQNEFS